MTNASDAIYAWLHDPVLFVREVLQAEPDAWQIETLQALTCNNRIALKASKGCGKTTLLAWAAWWFLATRPHPKVVATSITEDNLSDGLWAEMAKWQAKSPYLKANFVWQKTRIVAKAYPETWFMSARTWSKSADTAKQADTLAGLHAEHLIFILDEVGGIPDSVMAAAEAGLATGGDTKLLMAGNPTNLEGPLYRACTNERHLWWVREITGDPDDPMRASRISIQWAKDQIDKYGRDNPWVLVNVFGRFPPGSLNTLLGVEEVSAAMRNTIGTDKYEFAQKRLGIDVARFGDDKTVIFPRQGLVAYKPVEMRNARTNDIAARIFAAKSKWGSELEFVDDTGGYGAGVIDSLIQSGLSPNAIHFSGKAIDPRYYNKRSEMWFMMAAWVKRGAVLPNIPELAAELVTPTYTFINGKFRLEEKDQIKDRLGRSPDFADALALTFALPEMPASLSSYGILDRNANKAISEFDPFADKYT
jgi:phage terminase large subunit